MPELAIPPLKEGLECSLREIVSSKKYTKKSDSEWSSEILPQVLARIEEITDVAITQGEKYNKRPEGIDLPKAIVRIKKKIEIHLKTTFMDNPPFTLHRIAEIILRPEQEGYALTNNAQILKYFNSFSKLVVVASSVNDYPDVMFLNSDTAAMNNSKHITQTVPLIEIPWLNEEKPSKEKNSSGNSLLLDPMLISSPPAIQESMNPDTKNGSKKTVVESKSPTRRRREQDSNDEHATSPNKYIAKRARKDDKLSPSKNNGNDTEEFDDKMDISSSTLEEITQHAAETPIKSENDNSDSMNEDHNNTADSEMALTNKDHDNDNKMDISSENLIVSDEEPLVY